MYFLIKSKTNQNNREKLKLAKDLSNGNTIGFYPQIKRDKIIDRRLTIKNAGLQQNRTLDKLEN